MFACLPDVFELQDATACHLKISAITPPAWKGHLDNQLDLKPFDLHDRCYARQVVVDNAVNRRARDLLKVVAQMKGECEVLKADVVSNVVPNVATKLVQSDDMDPYASVEVLLSKKPWIIQHTALTRTQMSTSYTPSQKATSSPALMYPPPHVISATAASLKAQSLPLV
nr:hypothetical protein [Tanacetum cinerariifolium]